MWWSRGRQALAQAPQAWRAVLHHTSTCSAQTFAAAPCAGRGPLVERAFLRLQQQHDHMQACSHQRGFAVRPSSFAASAAAQHAVTTTTTRGSAAPWQQQSAAAPSSSSSSSSSSCRDAAAPSSPPSSADPHPAMAGVAAAAAAAAAAAGAVDVASAAAGLGQLLTFSLMMSGGRHDWLRNLGFPTPLPLVTAALLATNAGVFVMQQLDPSIVYSLGEIPYKIRQGEWWRLITPVFLHGGVLHMLVNSYALFSLGSALEAPLGRARFAAVYFGSALTGNLAAALLTANSFHVGVGSSTALYGLFGSYTAQLLRSRGVRGAMASGEMNSVLLTMAINAAITLAVPGMSIWGHVGGFLGGAALLQLTRGWTRRRF